jgi:hypothetical protein
MIFNETEIVNSTTRHSLLSVITIVMGDRDELVVVTIKCIKIFFNIQHVR